MSAETGEFSDADRVFMLAALEQAKIALDEGEVPVGCVIVRSGEIVSRGRNMTNATRNGTRHAEFGAIDELLRKHNGSTQGASFSTCRLYVTCEPCIMCAGAISLVRFQSVIYGCPNDKFGGNGSIIPVHELGCGGCGACATTQSEQKCDLVPKGYPYPSRGGLFAQEAIKLLQDFYTAGNPNAPKPHRPLRGSSAFL